MGPEPVLDRLDQGGAEFALTGVFRLLDGLTGDLVHRQRVHAVDLDALEAVGGGLLGQGGTRRLALARHRDSPLVVITEEHVRRVEDAGEVQPLVEVAL